MQVLITGADGQLGRELCRQLGPAAIVADRSTLDITNEHQVHDFVVRRRPTAVINCAAYTQVDRAETEPALCAAVNIHAVRSLATACRAADSVLVQVSTDYVFGADRQRRLPYRETDTPGPQSVYASTKLAGERYAVACPRHYIVRTCGLYGLSPNRENFVETMLRLAQAGRHLRVVNDQRCSPSYVVHIARGILFLLTKEAYGLYHVVSTGETTWYEFAREIFRQAEIQAEVEPITAEQYGAPAVRPGYSVLDTSKYHAARGPAMSPWAEALAEYLVERGLVIPRL